MTRIAVVGMSHVEALVGGWDAIASEHPSVEVIHYNLRRFRRVVSEKEFGGYRYPVGERERAAIESAKSREDRSGDPVLKGYIDLQVLLGFYAEAIAGADAIALYIEGNEHNIVGLLEVQTVEAACRTVRNSVRKTLETWLPLLLSDAPSLGALVLPPPPVGSHDHIRRFADVPFQQKLHEFPIRSTPDRLEVWRQQCDESAAVAARFGLSVIHAPPSTRDADGMLAPTFYARDATHGNSDYGAEVMRAIVRQLAGPPGRKSHPYADLPDRAFWSASMSRPARDAIDPVGTPKFLVTDHDRVATAGSCFAQHIAKRLASGGFRFLVSEPSPAGAPESDGGFSARYGNVYTARQLLQLFDRAFGYFHPIERAWKRDDGRYCDPFRPRGDMAGHLAEASVAAAAAEHLAAVRRMFLDLDVFVFTLGLTECWRSRLDGAAYPLAPGVAGGRFDPRHHEFTNFRVADVVDDMEAFLGKLRIVNPEARVILTVSPVPLAATYSGEHVLVATTHSKSVLRVAAGELADRHEHVQYFPSYEIITGPHAGGRYFAQDLRDVTTEGVDHVMRIFMQRMTTRSQAGTAHAERESAALAEIQAIVETQCDEVLYDTRRDAPGGS